MFPGEEFDRSWGKELLERPTPSEPSAFPEIRFPRPRIALIVGIDRRTKNIRQINVASSRVTVLAKHGVDRAREFGVISLVDTAGINPKV